MKHVWSILCRDSSVDLETRSLSLFNFLSEININDKFAKSKQKVIPIKIELISFWINDDNDDEKLEIKIELLDPKNKVLDYFDKTIEFKKGSSKLRNRIRVEGLPFSGQGRYFFRVKQKENKNYKIVSNVPLDIKFKK